MTTAIETVGQYVAHDNRTAAIFSKYKIDFCCKGHRTVEEVCEEKGLTPESLKTELFAVMATKAIDEVDFTSWPAAELADYIEKNHHKYIEEKTPILLAYLHKLCAVHGDKHPELHEINTLFQISAAALAHHMKKEELVLFPFIKKMQMALQEQINIVQPPFGSIDTPLGALQEDHESEGNLLAKIAELTNQYTPPAEACETYQITLALLREFEQNLHQHIHLENNILFLKAKEMEGLFSVIENT